VAPAPFGRQQNRARAVSTAEPVPMKTHYDLLGLPPDAPPGEIKRAFRREIARYHPDKVQHLGQEFQAMAAGRAAELTEAYRILMDIAERATYDASLACGAAAPSRWPAAAAQTGGVPPSEPERRSPPAPAGPAASAADDFLRKAALRRFQEVAEGAIESLVPSTHRGFDLAFSVAPKRWLFRKPAAPVRVLGKFVPRVDEARVREAWSAAARSPAAAGTETWIFLMVPSEPPAREIASTIAEQRRRTRGGAVPLVVPLDVRDWDALVPTEAGPVLRDLLQALRATRSRGPW
jgi:curved DNA-binding protein CbpA